MIFYICFLFFLDIPDYSMFPLKELPKEFLSSMYNCSKYFSDLQISVIENNIGRFLNKIENDTKYLTQLQYFVSKVFVDTYKIQPIDASDEIVGQQKLQVKIMDLMKI